MASSSRLVSGQGIMAGSRTGSRSSVARAITSKTGQEAGVIAYSATDDERSPSGADDAPGRLGGELPGSAADQIL
jgi:hypothetical protein